MSNWYSQDLFFLQKTLDTNLKIGLTPTEAQRRRGESAANDDLIFWRRTPFFKALVEQASNPRSLALLFLGIAGLMYGLSESAALYIGGAVLGLTIIEIGMRTAQQIILENHLSWIERGSYRTARAMRGGQTAECFPNEIVPGDVIHLQAGDYVPADARVFESNRLRVNEFPLTGFSDMQEKQIEPLEGSVSRSRYSDQTNMVFAGTFVHAGSGKAAVVAIGSDRAICKKYARQTIQLPKSESSKRIERIAPYLTWTGCVGGVVLTVALLALGSDVLNAAAAGAALFAAAAPGYGAIASAIVFTQGMRQLRSMDEAWTIVQKPEALEKMSGATALCFDPKGVLTYDRISPQQVLVDGQIYDVEAIRQMFQEESDVEDAPLDEPAPPPAAEPDQEEMPNGEEAEESDQEETPNGEEPEPEPTYEKPQDMYMLLLAASLCAKHSTPGEEGVTGVDPLTLEALYELNEIVGLPIDHYDKSLVKKRETPYNSETKWQRVVFEKPDGSYVEFIIGRSPQLIDLCRLTRMHGEVVVLPTGQREYLKGVNHYFQSDYMQTLTIAYRDIDDLDALADAPERMTQNVIFLGMLCFHNEPREDVQKVIQRCRDDGLRLMVISDGEISHVESMARHAGLLSNSQQSLSGEAIQQMEDEELMLRLDDAVVCAQMPSEQKARVIQMLQQKDQCVAFLGSQLADIPALEAADIGLAPYGGSADALAHEAGALVLDSSLGGLYNLLKFAKNAGRRVAWTASWTLSVHIGLAAMLIASYVLFELNKLWPFPLDIRMPEPPSLGAILWTQLLALGYPLTVMARSVNLTPSRRRILANQLDQRMLQWRPIMWQGIYLGAAGVIISLFIGASAEFPDMHKSALYMGLLTFLCCALVMLMRGLAGIDTSRVAFFRANGGLLVGFGFAVVVAVFVTATPALGVIEGSAPDALAGVQFPSGWMGWLGFAALTLVSWRATSME